MSDYTVAAHTHDELGEVPVWCDRTRKLWWIDVLRPAVHSLDPATGETSTHVPAGGRIGSIALTEQGGLLVANNDGLSFFDPATGAQHPFVGRESLRPGQFYNDGRCDRLGRFWVGTMTYTFEPVSILYRVDPDGTLTPWFEGITVTNGIAFGLDDKTLYLADTRAFHIAAFDFDPVAGAITNHRLFSDTRNRAGRPDGSCIDSENFMWNAEYAGGQITRYAPDGRIDRVIETPVSHPTSVCFGGPDFDTLYVTSGRTALTPEQAQNEPLAGSILAYKPGVRGVPEGRFKGWAAA